MIVEERIYTLVPGKTGEYFKNYEEFGLPVQLPLPFNRPRPSGIDDILTGT